VTRKPGEEYDEYCLVLKFKKLTTVIVWGAICGDQKSQLVVWETNSWGKISSETYIEHVIHPILLSWWQQLCCQGSYSGYLYFQQDGASAHKAQRTKMELDRIGIGPYVFP
ncbi:hypothetical protein HOY82DRAFT_489388, partial [Tuber indicum]